MLIQFPKTTMSSHYLNFRDIVRWCMVMSLNLDPQKSPKSAFLLLVSSVTAPLIDPFSTDQQPHSSKHMKFTIVAPTQGKNPIKSRQQHSAVIAVVSSSKYFFKKKKNVDSLQKDTCYCYRLLTKKDSYYVGGDLFEMTVCQNPGSELQQLWQLPLWERLPKVITPTSKPRRAVPRSCTDRILPFFSESNPKGSLKKDSKNWIDKCSDIWNHILKRMETF